MTKHLEEENDLENEKKIMKQFINCNIRLVNRNSSTTLPVEGELGSYSDRENEKVRNNIDWICLNCAAFLMLHL